MPTETITAAAGPIPGSRPPALPSIAMVVGAMSSIQIGAAIATSLFDEVGPSGAVFLRLFVSAILLAIIWRPSYRLDRESAKIALAFGVVMAGMNISFYQAIDRIPLGTAVTLEFIGPLAVALITSHRRRDMVWAAMAAAGILLLSGGIESHGLDPLGIGLALLGGLFWGAYILLGKPVGQIWTGARGLAIAMAVSTLVSAPFGLAEGGSDLLEPSVIAVGAAVAVLSTTIPLSLEIEAMRRLPSNVFGVMMSLEPAVAATAGFLLLSQRMNWMQVVAILLVVAASAGALWTGRGPAPVDP